jgi:hypothetical protein
MTSQNPQLKLPDLVLGLERFGDRYAAIDVFADDLLEIRSAESVAALVDMGGDRFTYWYQSKSYLLEVIREAGVVRLSRFPSASAAAPEAAPAVLAGLAGTAAIGAALSKKGEGAAFGLILGLLAGAVIGAQQSSAPPRRVFALRFDSATGQWRPYDGGLVPWMKENLLPQSA